MRLVRDPTGELVASAASAGRGAWLCAGSARCLHEALRRRALERALGVDREAVDRLAERLGGPSAPGDPRARPTGPAPVGEEAG